MSSSPFVASAAAQELEQEEETILPPTLDP
jgi:hypothetical protein